MQLLFTAAYNADDFEQILSDLWKLIKMKVNQETKGQTHLNCFQHLTVFFLEFILLKSEYLFWELKAVLHLDVNSGVPVV